jgi:hypothetical protein
MKKVFLVFACSHYRNLINSALRLINEVKELELFDEIIFYTAQDLMNDKEFWDKHGTFIMNNKRGFGYWIWKPYLIMKTMEKLNEGDILLYLDAECRVVLEEKQYLLKYFDIVKKNKILYFYSPTHMIGLPEITMTKMDLIHKLNMQNDNDLLNMHQFGGGIQLIFVCKEILDLQKSIYNYASENYHNIDDTPSIIPNHPNYLEHRHDQSLFSLLIKKYNLISDTIITKCIYSRGIYQEKFLT